MNAISATARLTGSACVILPSFMEQHIRLPMLIGPPISGIEYSGIIDVPAFNSFLSGLPVYKI